MNDKTKIGFVKEVIYGDKPCRENPITLLPAQVESITVEAKKQLRVNARFDCPCCGKGIQIEINQVVES